jgi:hypothetical protein
MSDPNNYLIWKNMLDVRFRYISMYLCLCYITYNTTLYTLFLFGIKNDSGNNCNEIKILKKLNMVYACVLYFHVHNRLIVHLFQILLKPGIALVPSK